MGTHAACSNVMLSGFNTNTASAVQTYSAKAPLHVPKTASPGLNVVTLLPTATTSPAQSTPGRGLFKRQSSGLTEAARICTRTSLSLGTGLSISTIWRSFPDLVLV